MVDHVSGARYYSRDVTRRALDALTTDTLLKLITSMGGPHPLALNYWIEAMMLAGVSRREYGIARAMLDYQRQVFAFDAMGLDKLTIGWHFCQLELCQLDSDLF